MRKKDLALRVLSTATFLAMVTSCMTPAFAGTYYIGNEDGDLEITTKDDGTVTIKHGNKTYTEDGNEEIVIKGAKGSDAPQNTASMQDAAAPTTIGESSPIDTPEEPAGAAEDAVDDAFSVEDDAEAQPAGSADEPASGTDAAEGTAQDAPAPAEEESTAQPTADTGSTDPAAPAADLPQQGTGVEGSTALPEDEADGKDAVVNEVQQPTEEQQAQPTADAGQSQQAQQAGSTPVAADTPASQSEDDDTTSSGPVSNVIKVVNNWANKVNKVLNIRLDNVNIKVGKNAEKAAMSVDGAGNTKIELDGKNILDASDASGNAGLAKLGEGTLTITDEKTDKGEVRTEKAEGDETGSLTAKAGSLSAGIGGEYNSPTTKNIVMEGYATIDATGSQASTSSQNAGAGIGGGASGSADNIVIRGHANVTAKTGSNSDAAAIGGGSGGSGTNIQIYDHATVDATVTRGVAAIGSGYNGDKASVTIGTEGKTQKEESVHVKATTTSSSGKYSIGNACKKTDVIIQGGATIEEAKGIGGFGGDTNVTIRDEAVVKNVDRIGGTSHYSVNEKYNHPDQANGKKATVTIQDHAKLEKIGTIGGYDVNELEITIKDHAAIEGVSRIGNTNDTGDKMDKLTIKIMDNAVIKKLGSIHDAYNAATESSILIDGGTIGEDGTRTGKVIIETSGTSGSESPARITAKKVEIKNNVFMKVDYKGVAGNENRILCNGTEMTKEELLKTISDDSEIWYIGYNNVLQKIVHGKNLCENHKNMTASGAPTCTVDGYEDYNCTYESENQATDPSCDYAQGKQTMHKVLLATGHSWGEGVVHAPTCTEGGYTEYTCTKGDASKRSDETAALDHLWKEDSRTGNCGVAGTIHYVCERDASHVKDVPVDATGNHSFNEWHQTKAPTCQEAGEEQRECGVCGHPETRPVEKLAHTEVVDPSTVKEPTCEEPGYTGDVICGVGGEFLRKGEEIPAKGHTPTVVGKKDATETEPGYTGDTVCGDCGKVLGKGKVIPATGTPADDNNNAAVQEGERLAAPELDVISQEGTHQFFTVSQNGTVRTYTSNYENGTLTGTMSTLEYLQEQGAETIVFTTNQRTSRFAVADLLALVDEGDVFYLRHVGAEEPTLLVITNDHTALLG